MPHIRAAARLADRAASLQRRAGPACASRPGGEHGQIAIATRAPRSIRRHGCVRIHRDHRPGTCAERASSRPWSMSTTTAASCSEARGRGGFPRTISNVGPRHRDLWPEER